MNLHIEKSWHCTNTYEHLLFLEGIELGGIQKQKYQFKLVEPSASVNEYKDMCLTRILGHKDDLPGSGRWAKTVNSCWVKDLNQYSFFMWSPEIQSHHAQNCIQLSEE